MLFRSIYKVSIVGRYYPAEGTDRISPLIISNSSYKDTFENELSRIDPALFAGKVISKKTLIFYPGYLVLQSEEVGARTVAPSVEKLPLKLIRPSIAGFYWQHLIYTVIWWLFALLTPLAPFYSRIQRKLNKSN